MLSTGSIAFICQPVGSIISGWITDPLGRKRAMFIVNVPHVIAWFMMYNASSIWQIFVANTLLGLGVGLMEAPIVRRRKGLSLPLFLLFSFLTLNQKLTFLSNFV